MRVIIAFSDSGPGSSDKFECDIPNLAIEEARMQCPDPDKLKDALRQAIQLHCRGTDGDDIPMLDLPYGHVFTHGNAITFTFWWKDAYFRKQFIIGFVYTQIPQ